MNTLNTDKNKNIIKSTNNNKNIKKKQIKIKF